MAKRRKIEVVIDELQVSDLTGNLRDAINMLEGFYERGHSGYEEIYLSPVYSYDDYDSLEVVGARLETDEELEERLAAARKLRAANKKKREKKQAQERKLYEKLKKKYEPNTGDGHDEFKKV